MAFGLSVIDANTVFYTTQNMNNFDIILAKADFTQANVNVWMNRLG